MSFDFLQILCRKFVGFFLLKKLADVFLELWDMLLERSLLCLVSPCEEGKLLILGFLHKLHSLLNLVRMDLLLLYFLFQGLTLGLKFLIVSFESSCYLVWFVKVLLMYFNEFRLLFGLFFQKNNLLLQFLKIFDVLMLFLNILWSFALAML